jgi:hypothetical protein
MSSCSSQHRVKQWTYEGIAATRARMETKQVIPERNILRADNMVDPTGFHCLNDSGQSLGISLQLCMPDVSPASARLLWALTGDSG